MLISTLLLPLLFTLAAAAPASNPSPSPARGRGRGSYSTSSYKDLSPSSRDNPNPKSSYELERERNGEYDGSEGPFAPSPPINVPDCTNPSPQWGINYCNEMITFYCFREKLCPGKQPWAECLEEAMLEGGRCPRRVGEEWAEVQPKQAVP